MRIFLTITFTTISLFASPAWSYCAWYECKGYAEGGDWCNKDRETCLSCGNNPMWCDDANDKPTSYCAWYECKGYPEGGDWCNKDRETCLSCGNNPMWCDGSNDKPTSYCAWYECKGYPEGGDWCNKDRETCLSCGNNPMWCDGSNDKPTSYCAWYECKGYPEGGDWCNKDRETCLSCGNNPMWCDGSNDKPTSYCAWYECKGYPEGGDWCNKDRETCLSCGNNPMWCDGANDNNNSTVPNGTATTTRYWDCSGGTCGCAYQPFDDKPSHCYSNALFDAPSGNPYGAKFYGTAAVSEALGGGYWAFNGNNTVEGCGKCWKVTGTSNVGSEEITTTLVLRGANFCPPNNPACANGKAHFNIAAPGFDYTPSSLSNTCNDREPDEKQGFSSCGSWQINGGGCDCSKFNNTVLRAGCENFLSLQWNNPSVQYEELEECPEQMKTPCSFPYPAVNRTPPEFCASNEPSPSEPDPTALVTSSRSIVQAASHAATKPYRVASLGEVAFMMTWLVGVAMV